MGKLSVSTLVTLDGVIQDPGGFGETEQGGWGNPYFTADALQIALEHLQAADYFLIGRVTYDLLHETWGNIKGGAYLDRMNEIRKLVASTTPDRSVAVERDSHQRRRGSRDRPAQAEIQRGHRGVWQRHASADPDAAQPDR